MNALKTLFDTGVNQCSPVQKDLRRKVEYDEKGIEVVSFVEVDYPSLQASLGRVDDWSLESLLKSGISPEFPIHTRFGTRLEAEQYINGLTSQLDTLFPEDKGDAPAVAYEQ